MSRRITDLGLRALKPKDKPYEKPIGDGLRVAVQPSGRRSFVVRYRFGGRTRKLTLHGGLTLAQARLEAARALHQLEQGKDPGAEKQHAKQRANADTLAAICDGYWKREGGKLRSADERRRLLDLHVLPTLGARSIGDIRRSDLVRLFDWIEEERGPGAADNVLALLRRIFNFHAIRDDNFRTPIVRGMARRNPKEHARSRILSDDELRAVWATADGVFGTLIKFLLLTGAREKEARGMARQELNGADWLLPAARNKTKVDLLRPLSAAAQGILETLPSHGNFVFSGRGTMIGGLQWRKARFDKLCGVTGWVLHDLRRTARSLMSRAGVNADHAERCLGHVIGGVRGVYDRHEYYHEKQQAFEALAAQIQRIVNPVENVVPMRG